MSPEITDLLDRGVPGDVTEPDFTALARRGVRRRHTKRVGGVAMAAVLVLGAGAVIGGALRDDAPIIGQNPAEQGIGEWHPTSEAPLLGREGAQTAVDGDHVLVWGGDGPVEGQELIAQDGTYRSEITFQDGAVYDAATDSWTHVPAPPISVRAWPHVALSSDAVVVWGGRELEPLGPGGTHLPDEQPALRDGAVYDLVEERWTALQAPPFDVLRPAAFDWDGEELLIWGGEGTAGAVGHGGTWTADDGWQRIADFPLAPRLGSFVAFDDERLVVWGGGTGLDADADGLDEQLVADGAVYDRATNAWTELPASPLAARWTSFGHGQGNTLLRDGRMLVAGGARTEPGTTQFRDGAWIDVSDLEAMAWQPIPDGPAETRFVATEPTGAFAVADGGDRSNRVWVYDLVDAAWQEIAPVGRDADAVLGAGTTPVVGASGGIGWIDPADGWRPVTYVRDGQASSPRLRDVRDARFWYSTARLDSGVFLFGGMSTNIDDDGSVGGDDNEWMNTAWFLPLPR